MRLHIPEATGDLKADKAVWREALRAARREVVGQLGEEGRAAQAAAIAEHALRFVREHVGHDEQAGLRGVRVSSYEQMRTEPPVTSMTRVLQEAGATVLVPITLGKGVLDWHDAADPGRTPLGSEAFATTDVALVPALAVDRRGVRMGKGGGYYDRAIALLAPEVPVVAVLHDHEWVAELPEGKTDRRVHGVLTAAGGVGWVSPPRA